LARELEEYRELRITPIGAHTVTHPWLNRKPAGEEIEQELELPRFRTPKSSVGMQDRYFRFHPPYGGDYNDTQRIRVVPPGVFPGLSAPPRSRLVVPSELLALSRGIDAHYLKSFPVPQLQEIGLLGNKHISRDDTRFPQISFSSRRQFATHAFARCMSGLSTPIQQ
jgi:hypothetical protein